jgi:hypothetical protein
MRRWITDAGQSLTLTTPQGEQIKLGRYGVWEALASDSKRRVCETSDDLAMLQRIYGPKLEVLPLPFKNKEEDSG